MSEQHEEHTPGTRFDPSKHLTKVSGKSYLEVKWRLVWFHEHHPNGSIVTEMVQHQNQTAVFKAAVSWNTPDGIATRTGWGSESSDDFGDYLEKAETKAIGRALAAAGFGTQFSADHDFGADRQRVVDSPVDIRSGRTPRGNAAGGTQEATPRQIKYLYAVAREQGIANDELEERCQESFGCDISSLNRRDVSALIEQIQANRPVAVIANDSFPDGDTRRAVVPPQQPPTASNGVGQAPMPITQSGSAGPITAAQKSVINQLLDPDSAEDAAQRMFKKNVRNLTTEEAQDLIDVERRAEAARN